MKSLISDEVRLNLSRDLELGAGNFLKAAIKVSPDPGVEILYLEEPLRTFFGETFDRLTYHDLDRLSGIYAALYRAHGVRAHDPVFVYLDDGVAYLIHYLALTRIGAIAVLTNGNMAPEIALAHARNVGATGIFSDANHLPQLRARLHLGEFTFVLSEEEITFDLAQLNVEVPDFAHVEDDPIMIAHSSGTTGVPKAVLLQHGGFFYGVRYRLSLPRVPGGETILSSLPHSHNCAIAYIMLALLSGTPVYITSDHRGASVLRRIAEFRPKMVVSFPQTYVEMTEEDLEAHDLSSVSLWFNGGDAAHESHIRALIRHGSRSRDGNAIPGSIFIDGMGSSEMGFSLFRNVHTPETDCYNRCIGQPLDWVDAQILGEDGRKLRAGEVGRLGVKAPSVTTGYWNNSVLTFRSRLAGYFLTGDLAYRDEQGRFYHVDRVPDVIHTATGPVYGLQIEEFLLRRFGDEVGDCSVLGVPDREYAKPVVHVRARKGARSRLADEFLMSFNRALGESGLPFVDEVRLSSSPQIPLGTTGKVLKRVLRAPPIVSPAERITT